MPHRLLFCFFLTFFGFSVSLSGAELYVGVAQSDITAPRSVPLQGQFHMRLSQGAETPLTANVTALESREGDRSLDSVIFVSIDLVSVSEALRKKVDEKVAAADASIDVKKLVLNGTHTHTAPTVNSTGPKVPENADVMPYTEILDFTAERITQAIVEAWKTRKPGKMSYGLDYAVVGFNRRATYADGRSVMYGNTNDPGFRGMEHTEDHDVATLFFRDANNKILSVIVNIACPSQVVEHLYVMNADYWHPVREKLQERFGKDVIVLGWCSAAGDLSPHIQYRKAAVERMNRLRNLNAMQEIARKIDRAVTDTWEAVKNEPTNALPLVHHTETLKLPMRKVTKEEYDAAQAEVDKIQAALKADPNKTAGEVAWMATGWHGQIVDRYKAQQRGDVLEFETTIHVIRLGDAVVCTNCFELFTDFGIRIKARSKAKQTFLIQLAGNGGGYLPTEKAVKGGGYSAVVQSTKVGPEGGQIFVDETLKLIDKVFE